MSVRTKKVLVTKKAAKRKPSEKRPHARSALVASCATADYQSAFSKKRLEQSLVALLDEEHPSDKRLYFRTSEAEKAFVARAARVEHKSLTEFVRTAIRERANWVLSEHAKFELADSDMGRLEAALNAPARVLPGLLDLLSRKSVFG